MIEPKYYSLNALFTGRVFRIPHYQRFYSWVKKQRDDLFSDLESLHKKGRDRHHFMATIVCYRTGEVRQVGSAEYGLYDVVDGQQRLTTLIILLRAIHDKLEEGQDKTAIGNMLVKTDENLLLLQTNNANERLFNDFLREGREPAEDDVKTYADRNLTRAIKECKQFVGQWTGSVGTLIDLLGLLRNRIGFVVYDTEDEQAVYTLFEVLNSRGLPVDPLDKCKTLLMGRAVELSSTPGAAESKTRELQKLWGRIYDEMALCHVSGVEILRVAATLLPESKGGKPPKADGALDAFRKRVQQPQDAIGATEWLYDVAKGLVELHKNPCWGPVAKILQARVLAVALMVAKSLTESERRKALAQWEKVTFRIYGLHRKDARTKVGDYVRLGRSVMRSEGPGSSYANIMAAISTIGEDYPIEGAVAEVRRGECYEGFEDEARYILWRYEEHLAREADAQVNEEMRAAIWAARSASETIEHIFPQNPERKGPWRGKVKSGGKKGAHVDSIGNMILLPPGLNSQAGNRGFEEKKAVYRKASGLRMITEVIERADWKADEIASREERISEWIRSEWADLPYDFPQQAGGGSVVLDI